MAESISAAIREGQGTRDARRLRREGRVPATIYSHGSEALSVDLEAKLLERAIDHGERLVELDIAKAGKKQVLIKEIQFHAISGGILHADFIEVKMDEKVTLSVPVVVHGTAAGVRDNGTVDHLIHEIEIECLAGNIPEEIRVEIAQLGVGESIVIGDVQLPDGVVTTAEPEGIVVSCRAVVEEEEEVVVAPEEGEAMPETIAEEKEEDAGDEPSEG